MIQVKYLSYHYIMIIQIKLHNTSNTTNNFANCIHTRTFLSLFVESSEYFVHYPSQSVSDLFSKFRIRPVPSVSCVHLRERESTFAQVVTKLIYTVD